MTEALPPALRPDCARCAGLCCVAPAFDADQGFGYDKPAGEACMHLQADNRCGIHPALVAQGFPGCASFNCFGAGQRATALFDSDWRESPARAGRIFETYSRLRTLHELMAMATVARSHAPDAAAAETVRQVLARLDRLCETNESVDGIALRRQTLKQIQQALRGVNSDE
jgi:hypothetical protein